MQHRFIRLLLMLAVLVTLGQTTARADTTEIANFSYHWSVTPGTSVPGSSGAGIVLFPLQPDGTASYAMAAGTPATLIQGANVAANAASADTFNNTPFGLTLSLKDTASGAMHDFSFSGSLSGSFTVGGDGKVVSTVTSTFNNPLMQSFLLGTHTYEVTIDPTILGVPSPTSNATALIDALVRVKNQNGGVTGNGGGGPGPTDGGSGGQAPEPSTLVLGGVAVLGMAARRWTRLKRRSV